MSVVVHKWPLRIVCFHVVLLGSLVFGAATARAQEPPGDAAPVEPTPTDPGGVPVETRIEAILAASAGLVAAADASAWQSADQAFNGLLDTLDAHRAPLEVARPDTAPAVFEEIEVHLAELDAALTSEDPVRIRAIDALLHASLARLAQIAPPAAAASPAADIVLAWRDAAGTIATLGQAGLWRDMRNAAIDLIDDIDTRSGVVRAAAGDAGALGLERASVFALRLRAAALDQSLEEAERAGRHFDLALVDLMQGLGLAATPTPAAADSGLARFRGYEVEAALGQRVILPIKAEGVPRIGLGAFSLGAKWSPSALTLVEIQPGEGILGLRSEISPGAVELTLPQAPLGLAADTVVASLVLDVVSDSVDARDYLSREVVDTVQGAVEEAVALVRLGDLPKAATAISEAHDAFVGGDEASRSASVLFAGEAEATSIERRFLEALRLLSLPEPAPSDEIVVALALLQSDFGLAIDQHLEHLSRSGAIPVQIEAHSAADASGRAMALRESVPGQVLLVEADPVAENVPTVEVDHDSLAELDLGLVTPPSVEDLEASFGAAADDEAPEDGPNGSTADGSGVRSSPRALLLAVGAAALIAALAAAAMARGGAVER